MPRSTFGCGVEEIEGSTLGRQGRVTPHVHVTVTATPALQLLPLQWGCEGQETAVVRRLRQYGLT